MLDQPYFGITEWDGPEDKDGRKPRGVNLYMCKSMAMIMYAYGDVETALTIDLD